MTVKRRNLKIIMMGVSIEMNLIKMMKMMT